MWDRDELPGMIATVARGGQTVYYEKNGWLDREARRFWDRFPTLLVLFSALSAFFCVPFRSCQVARV